MGFWVNILYSNNKAGLSKDAAILTKILSENGHDVNHIDFNKPTNLKKAHLNIFLQNFGERGHLLFDLALKNVLIPNQEWMTITDLQTIKKCDQIWCKTMYAHKLLEDIHPNRVFIGFTSEDLYFVAEKLPKVLHFKGLSCQKNTEMVKKLDNVTIFDSKNRYLPESEKTQIFNTFGYHLCPSVNEGWGHYVYEAFSCGANVILTDAPFFKAIPRNIATFLPSRQIETDFNSKEWLKIFPLRESYAVNIETVSIVLESLSQKPKFNSEARNFYLSNHTDFCNKFLSSVTFILSNLQSPFSTR